MCKPSLHISKGQPFTPLKEQLAFMEFALHLTVPVNPWPY